MNQKLNSIFAAGYLSGHNDTVDGNYTDVHVLDRDSYFEDVVREMEESKSLIAERDRLKASCALKDVVIERVESRSNQLKAVNEKLAKLLKMHHAFACESATYNGSAFCLSCMDALAERHQI